MTLVRVVESLRHGGGIVSPTLGTVRDVLGSDVWYVKQS